MPNRRNASDSREIADETPRRRSRSVSKGESPAWQRRAWIRYLHFRLAPVVVLPILLSLLTGSLFQVAVLTGRAEDFLWLLDWHRGSFGRLNLEAVYPFLNALGALAIAITGLSLWFQTPDRPRPQTGPRKGDR